MMFDAMVSDGAALQAPPPVILQFVSFQVAPLADGGLQISLGGTFLDEAVLEFVGEEIETLRVSTIDEAVAAIRRSLTDALKAHKQTEH
jgi:hypothetical protein